MKKLTLSLLAAPLVFSGLFADVITAVEVSEELGKVTSQSPIWKKAKFSDVVLYPQTAFSLNDKKANEMNEGAKAKRAKVAALYDGKNVALLLKWDDDTKNVQSGYKTDVYGDGFAVQFAQNASDPAKLPYIGMGSEGRPVVVYLQKAVEKFYEPNGKGDVSMQVNRHQTNYFEKELAAYDAKVEKLANRDYQKAFVSEGFRSMTEIKDGSAAFGADMSYGKNGWSGVVVRPIKDGYADLESSAIPVAFAVWDGSKDNRDGLKLLSGWTPIKLPIKKQSQTLAILGERVKGDVKNGKQIAMDNCAACHRYADVNVCPTGYMAPNLTNIGGYATAAYLRESINNPSAVVVADPNRNAHPNYRWYNLDEKGNRISSMPAFDWLDEKSKNDLIAYLQTLKEEVK